MDIVFDEQACNKKNTQRISKLQKQLNFLVVMLQGQEEVKKSELDTAKALNEKMKKEM